MQDNNRHSETDSSLTELRDLLADFTTGELTESQYARLDQLAIESEASRRFYIQYMFMYGTIHQEYCNGNKLQTTLIPAADCPTASEPTTEPNALPTSNNAIFPLLDMEKDLLSLGGDADILGSSTTSDSNHGNLSDFFGRINFSFVPALIMVIASTLILSAVVVLPIYWSIRSDDPQWSVAARITKTVDCYWGQDENWLREGSLLMKDQVLDLKLGLAEIEFTSGVKVVLEGPARFIVKNGNTTELNLGQLAATVPKGAEGFTVKTPGIEVVDLGTEFGVAVTTDESADVHVFKGAVEMETEQDKGKSQKIRLKKNEAIQYSQKSGDIARIPIDEKKFIRDLDHKNGVIANLRVLNPSFEQPDIRTIPEYQSQHGNTVFRKIYGWEVSDLNPKMSQVAMYQVSPFTSLTAEDYKVAPAATDGQQVAVVSLGTKPSPPGEARSAWIYQSLGVINANDVGKTLKLSVDTGPRSAYAALSQGKGTIFAGFALHVTADQSGTFLGQPATFTQKEEIKQLHHIEANVPITAGLVGQKLYILLAVSDDGSDRDLQQYYFDNVKVTVQK